jgi:hypothetical protein
VERLCFIVEENFVIGELLKAIFCRFVDTRVNSRAIEEKNRYIGKAEVLLVPSCVAYFKEENIML